MREHIDDPQQLEALETARAKGVHRLKIATPFAVGPVNLYLVEGPTPTLVDCGPDTATGLGAIETGLRGLGYALSDIDLILVTHQHVDHVGMLRPIAERSGARTACLDLLAPIVETWFDAARQDDADALAIMRRHGVDPAVAEALQSVSEIMAHWGAPATIDRRLAEGEVLDLGDRSLEVQLRPGHSPSDTVFLDAANRLALCGDHLLADVSSNALLTRPLDPAGGYVGSGGEEEHRPRPLLAYRDSLRRSREVEADVWLGGHHGPVVDHRTLIDERLAGHERRAQRFLSQLDDGTPRTAHEIATATWGQVAITQAYLTLSEVLGHLDLLLADGVIAEDRSQEVIRFSKA